MNRKGVCRAFGFIRNDASTVRSAVRPQKGHGARNFSGTSCSFRAVLARHSDADDTLSRLLDARFFSIAPGADQHHRNAVSLCVSVGR